MILKKSHIIEYIALINLQFPNAYQFSADRDKETFISLWFEGLKSYPKEFCDVAVRNALYKAEFAPKIATVIKEAESLFEAHGSSDGELWNELVSAVGSIRNELLYASERYDTVIHEETGLTTAGEARKRIAKVFDGLDIKLKEYCGSMRGFMDLAQVDEADLQFEKGRFMKQMHVITERIKVKQQTPPQLASLIKSLAGGENKNLLGDNA